jgi:hypothetical protein
MRVTPQHRKDAEALFKDSVGKGVPAKFSRTEYVRRTLIERGLTKSQANDVTTGARRRLGIYRKKGSARNVQQEQDAK